MTDTSRFDRLVRLLKELFQLDKPELDFGFYRIMHARSREVTQFLEKDLPPRVRKAFAEHRSADQARVEAELTEATRNARALGMDPDQVDKVTRLRKKLGDATVDIAALESDVYDHLYRFFRRYYDEGDFLSKRVYKDGVYAIPYAGEEVKLHWANADQYYIKTDEYLKNYSFRLRPNAPDDPMRAHFRLVDATEGEHGNVQAGAGQKRLFVLAGENPVALERGRDSGRDELVIRFEYRPVRKEEDWPDWARKGKARVPNQDGLKELAEERIAEAGKGRTELYPWMRALEKPHRKAGTNARTTTVGKKSKGKPKSLLRAHLDRYTARNTFDYFIHKDLGPFLRRELDFYIKNEVMHLDDIENDTAPSVEQYLSKIRVIRRIAHTLIDFLAELEGFQKKLWLKKKFVVETRWLVRVGVIADVAPGLLKEIAANDAQREEWVELCGMDESPGDQGELMAAKYEVPLTVAFLKQHPTLMADTRHFDDGFTARLLAAFDDLDAVTDGVLVHGENFQALGLLGTRYRGQVKCVYIDPPYNTAASEILYKNDYRHSAWMTMMANRLRCGAAVLAPHGTQIVAIDDTELAPLCHLLDDVFRHRDRLMVVVNHHPAGAGLEGTNVSSTHEYAIFVTPRRVGAGRRILIGEPKEETTSIIGFKRTGAAESNSRTGRPNSFYAVLVDADRSIIAGVEPPPRQGEPYPTTPTEEGYRRVYPLGQDGAERVWRRSYESSFNEIADGNLLCKNGRTIYLRSRTGEKYRPVFSNWVDAKYNAGVHGTNVLRDLMGGRRFDYPKSIHTVTDCVAVVTRLERDTTTLDYFAGSGTTGHAVINLNREDGGTRKFILVEVGEHFDTVLVPRLKKVTYSPEWKNGRPIRAANADEADRSPRVIKSLRIESYEDTLNNLTIAQYPSKKQGGGAARMHCLRGWARRPIPARSLTPPAFPMSTAFATSWMSRPAAAARCWM